MTSYLIFKNRNALSHNYVPDKILHRDEEIKMLSFYLSFVFQGSTPPNVLILGKPGTGKTVVTRRVLSDFKKEVERRGVDVAVGYCVATKSPIETLVNLVRDIGYEDVKYYRGQTFGEVKSTFEDTVGNRMCVVVVDEVDKLVISHRADELLYFLTRREKTSLITISNKVFVENMVKDSSVKSSWRPRKIVFKDYDAYQLYDILKYRAEQSFVDGVIDDGVLRYIAAITVQRGGDVRYALDVLAMTGDIASMEGKGKVTIELVKRAIEKVEEEYIRESLSSLNFHQKILLLIVALAGEISPSEAYDVANRVLLILRSDKAPLTQRRWSDHRNELELLGFLELVARGKGKGRGWMYSLKIPDMYDPEKLVKYLKEDLLQTIEFDGDESLMAKVVHIIQSYVRNVKL